MTREVNNVLPASIKEKKLEGQVIYHGKFLSGNLTIVLPAGYNASNPYLLWQLVHPDSYSEGQLSIPPYTNPATSVDRMLEAIEEAYMQGIVLAKEEHIKSGGYLA